MFLFIIYFICVFCVYIVAFNVIDCDIVFLLVSVLLYVTITLAV